MQLSFYSHGRGGTAMGNLTTAFLGFIAGIITVFVTDRLTPFLYRTRNSLAAIKNGPTFHITEIYSDAWCNEKEDGTSHLLQLQSYCSEFDGQEILTCDFLLLHDTESEIMNNGKKIFKIKISNKTDDGLTISKLLYTRRPTPNIYKWSGKDLDAHSTLIIYVEPINRPDSIIIKHNSYKLTYELTPLRLGYIKAIKAAFVKR